MDPKLQYLENLRRKGYTENFTAVSSSSILTDHKRIYQPGELKITSFYTCSGEADPLDYSVMFAIETYDGKKGILINEHCERPDDKVESFINCIKLARQHNKKLWFKHSWQKMFRIKFSMNI